MKQLIGTFATTIIKVVLIVAVVFGVYKLSLRAYDFGYQIFADIPVAAGDGRTVNVIISEGQGGKEVGKLLEEKGLVRDATIFYIQELLSENEGSIQPGTYELNTAMTSEEMIRIMYGTKEEEEE